MSFTLVPTDLLSPGGVVQVQHATTGAVDTTTTTIPNDDTIPQNTEGKEFLTCSITPKSATNKLLIEVHMQCSPSASANVIAALFKDSDAGALAAAFQIGSGASEVRRISFSHYVTAGSTSAQTYKVRAGLSTAGTLTLNGSGGSRLFGGIASSSITITEIAA